MKIIKNKQYYKDLFHKSGLKYTEVRESIFKIIEKSNKPISSIDILGKIEKEFFLNKTTLYRNIDSLQKSDLINVSNFGQQKIHCEIKKPNKNHSNISYKLICKNCQTFENIDLKLDFKKVFNKIIKNNKFQNKQNKNDLRVEIFSECDKCIKNKI